MKEFFKKYYYVLFIIPILIYLFFVVLAIIMLPCNGPDSEILYYEKAYNIHVNDVSIGNGLVILNDTFYFPHTLKQLGSVKVESFFYRRGETRNGIELEKGNVLIKKDKNSNIYNFYQDGKHARYWDNNIYYISDIDTARTVRYCCENKWYIRLKKLGIKYHDFCP